MVKKVVLAYSGGLDTSVILKWAQETYQCEIVTFTADIGQGEEIQAARDKALSLGVKEVYVEDLRQTFVRDYVYPMFRANAVYEGTYLLGTAIARPLIARRQIEIAAQTGADAVAHGATGKGNDQIRFELSYAALNPHITVIAPWREWTFKSRSHLLDYAQAHGIPISSGSVDQPPYSTDANLLHISYEGKALEDPWIEPDPDLFQWTRDPEQAPETPEYLEISFENGDPIAVNNVSLSPDSLLSELNRHGARHGIGRLDLVESRFIGIKSRGVYETPGGTLLALARRALESLTLDPKTLHLKDSLMPEYARMIYQGYWFSPERQALQALIDQTQKHVSGNVRLKLYKGLARVVGRVSPRSLYNQALATFEEDTLYDQSLASGFIKLNALRLRLNHDRSSKP